MDRLDRNAMDVPTKVETLAEMDLKVHCLALGGVYLTSSTGRMMMSVIDAVAEFERDFQIERTHAGLIRAEEHGKVLGRQPQPDRSAEAGGPRKAGKGGSVLKLLRNYGVSRQTVQRARDEGRNDFEVKNKGVRPP